MAPFRFSINWNCCVVSASKYRKYELGTVRNENAYRFNFTLANIGTAGNLRRAERLFLEDRDNGGSSRFRLAMASGER